MISISLWRKSDVETIRGPCGLKVEEKEQTVGGFVLAGSAQEKPKQLKLWLLDKVFVPLNGDLVTQVLKLETVSWLKHTQVLMSKMAMKSTSS